MRVLHVHQQQTTAVGATVNMSNAHGRRIGMAALGVLLVTALLLAGGAYRAASAMGATEIDEFTVTPSTLQAGSHPDVVMSIKTSGSYVKDMFFELPPGFIGNPHVASRCTAEAFGQKMCPQSAQVGLIALKVGVLPYALIIPIYNMVPAPGQAGLLAFILPALGAGPIYIELSARTGTDYGLNAVVRNASQIAEGLPEIRQILWGVPADPVHDPVRMPLGAADRNQWWCPGPGATVDTISKLLVQNIMPSACVALTNSTTTPPSSSDLPEAPFLSTPSRCSGPLTATLTTTSYDGETDTAQTGVSGMTGCDKLTFDPSLAANPTTKSADTAAGLDVELLVPQFQSPTTPSPSPIRANTVILPEGFSINPNAADGKTFCSDAQANFGSEAAAQCPDFSKIGTTSIESSALPGPIQGGLYIGEPKPGERYRVILTADGFGTHVKQLGVTRPNPVTGQVEVTFEDLPESPMQRFSLHIFGSERGLFATPTHCGTYPVRTKFTPWNDQLGEQESVQFFVIDSGPEGRPCPPAARSLSPDFVAGTDDATAGQHTSFGLELERDDGDQNLARLNVVTPPGFSAKLVGVAYCPEPALATLTSSDYSGVAEKSSPICPASSEIGRVITGAGAGTRPLHIGGRVYLAGPYKGAPLSLVVVVPAVSGPYDLGTVAVRTALHVDPVTAQVHAHSDPFPSILEGIPLRLRFVQIALDRPGFALNPTNCDPFAVSADVFGDQGAVAGLSSPFQAANCTDLDFGPKLRLRLRGNTKRTGNPALQAVLRANPGEANIGRATVLLSRNTLIDNANIRTICTRVQFNADNCPEAAIYGHAVARSPLLAEPLSGPVYLRAGDNRLPDLVVDLRGQIGVELAARIDSKNGRLRTVFPRIPDVPVSEFVLNMQGGQKSLIQNSANLCSRNNRALVVMNAQNGARQVTRPKLRVACGGRASSRNTRKEQRRAGLRLARKVG